MNMSATSSSDQKQSIATGGWIPWVFVGLFLIVLAVNGTMITIAVSTFTGLETTNAYEKGLTYNNRLDALSEQDRLGWGAVLDATPSGDQRVTLAFGLRDQLGNPITSADVQATLLRPVQEGFDLEIRLDDQGNGNYSAAVDLPLAGQWDIQLTAKARNQTYHLAKRIHIAP